MWFTKSKSVCLWEYSLIAFTYHKTLLLWKLTNNTHLLVHGNAQCSTVICFNLWTTIIKTNIKRYIAIEKMHVCLSVCGNAASLRLLFLLLKLTRMHTYHISKYTVIFVTDKNTCLSVSGNADLIVFIYHKILYCC